MPGTFEPSDGNQPNYGPGTSIYDDAGHYYATDHDFFNLCGPGAADVALWYWPSPPNLITNNNVVDTAHTSTSTSWTSERMRGYMTYLAWQTQIPGWGHTGMMDSQHYYSYGVTNYGMRDGLNWEASGRSASTWSSYFYAITWWNQSNQAGLHDQVVSDISSSSAPVVPEVNAAMLPNWLEQGLMIHHYITIIGYDNTKVAPDGYLGVYYYTDTCAQSTGCGDQNHGSDGTVHEVSQSLMWQAISNIPVNTSTDPSAGDGGWIW